MAARLPPLSHARDAEFWRQRIQKEQRVADYKEVFAAAGLVSPRFLAPMSPRAAPVVRSQPFSSYYSPRPFTATNMDVLNQPWRPTPTLLSPRSPELSRELQKGWTEPPLIMAKSFAEPPQVFRRYLEASTNSVHKPSVSVLPWKY